MTAPPPPSICCSRLYRCQFYCAVPATTTQPTCFYFLGSALTYKINVHFCDNLNTCFDVHFSPANWWCLHCSPGSPAWCFFSCTPSLEPKRGSSHIAVVWRTYHTVHCSTSQRTVLRGKTQNNAYFRNVKKYIFDPLSYFQGRVGT